LLQIKRKTQNHLNQWKLSTSRKPLIIRQARQVEKKPHAIIGGMPEAVKPDIKQLNLSDLPRIYESIWASIKVMYRNIALMIQREKSLNTIMDTSPLCLDERIRFQGFGNSNYKSREVGEAFRTLDDAKIIRLIYSTTVLTPSQTKLFF